MISGWSYVFQNFYHKMKTAADFEVLVAGYKADFDEATNKLTHRYIRKGLVIYIHSCNKAKEFLATSRKIKLVAESSNICGEINLNALKRLISRIIDNVNLQKKKLTRNWEKLVKTLDEECVAPIVTTPKNSESSS